jgi:hypothetical protein
MRQSRPRPPLLLAALLAVALVGCNGAERQRREQAERDRAGAVQRQLQLGALVNRCRRQQPTVQKLVQEHDRTSTVLTRLNQQRYSPLPQPGAPDPAVLARFTREDQEMEQERYQQALARWRAANGAERRRWEGAQEARRQELTARELKATQNLQQLGVAATPEARAAWSRCEPQQLAAVALG